MTRETGTDLRADLPRHARARRTVYGWIDEDSDLAPPPRSEIPLSAWGEEAEA